MNQTNPCGIRGIEFVEYAPNKPGLFHELFLAFGFSRVEQHRSQAVSHYAQNDIHFLVNSQPSGFAAQFAVAHGPSICGLALRVDDAQAALEAAVARGAKPYTGAEGRLAFDLPAVYGIGDSLLYFVEQHGDRGRWYDREFEAHAEPVLVPHKGFLLIDHLTNNVHQGTLETWGNFYKDIFGFTEVRHFDIRGEQTGLYSYALRSPDGSFCIPVNQGTEEKSQIEEYLREYHGPGIQHLALLSEDLLGSLDEMRAGPVSFLDIDDAYYQEVFDRVPRVTEDHGRIKTHQVLVDGDEEGYLLQIFTKNIIGPIFFELIQRKNHYSFGEGNFGALFRSIERDQARRGVL
jgi:4-hydroxyphenylpyruvate dioxygenase